MVCVLMMNDRDADACIGLRPYFVSHEFFMCCVGLHEVEVIFVLVLPSTHVNRDGIHMV